MARPTVSRLVALLLLVGCEHTTPFELRDPEPIGPVSAQLPLRLTFNPSEDRDPAAGSDVIVFSRLEPGRPDLDRCLAFLPARGGTLLRSVCAGGPHADGVTDGWLRPALSAGGQIAYVRERATFPAIAPTSRHLVVAPVAAPDSVTDQVLVLFQAADGRRITALRELQWAGSDLRFVAGQDSFPRVAGVFDTLFTPVALAELTPAVGVLREIPGTSGAFAHASAPDGGIWFVTIGAPSTLMHVAPDGSGARVVGTFSRPVVALTAVDGQPVAVMANTDSALVEWLDAETGAWVGVTSIAGEAGRIVSVPGSRRLVLELRRGTNTDLWLLELP